MSCGGCTRRPSGWLDWLKRGMRGWLSLLRRSDRVSRDVMELRLRICVGHGAAIPRCDKYKAGLYCDACGCVVRGKVWSKSEHCPMGKW